MLLEVEGKSSNQSVCVLDIFVETAWTHINICNNELVECLPPRGESVGRK